MFVACGQQLERHAVISLATILLFLAILGIANVARKAVHAVVGGEGAREPGGAIQAANLPNRA
jgi:hypothetical protein